MLAQFNIDSKSLKNIGVFFKQKRSSNLMPFYGRSGTSRKLLFFPPLMAIRIFQYRQWIRTPIRIQEGQIAKDFFVNVS